MLFGNGANSLAGYREDTNFEFVKDTVSSKRSKVKHNRMRNACKLTWGVARGLREFKASR